MFGWFKRKPETTKTQIIIFHMINGDINIFNLVSSKGGSIEYKGFTVEYFMHREEDKVYVRGFGVGGKGVVDLAIYFKDFTNPTQNELDMFSVIVGAEFPYTKIEARGKTAEVVKWEE